MLIDIDAAEVLDLLTQPYQFGECVDLQNHTIRGALRITDKEICGVDMSGCVFNDEVDFAASVFQGLAWFKDVKFRGKADFHRVRFLSDARFDNTVFHGGASFKNAAFCGIGCFDGLVAHKVVSMQDTMAYGNLSLTNCDFQNSLVISNATLMGGLWMPGTSAEQLENFDTCTILGRIEQFAPS